MDYGKYLYEKQKRERESRKAQKQIEIKEVRLRPKTDEHDIQVVLSKIRKFAKEGAKIRVRIRFRGREIYHPEVAQEIMQRIANDVAEIATVEAQADVGRSQHGDVVGSGVVAGVPELRRCRRAQARRSMSGAAVIGSRSETMAAGPRLHVFVGFRNGC